MKKCHLQLITGVAALLLLQLTHAQTTPSSVEEASQNATSTKGQASDTSGLTVEEVRIRNRLDRVIIQRGEDGPSEYYEFDDASEIYQDGSLTERGVMRQWRIGGKP